MTTNKRLFIEPAIVAAEAALEKYKAAHVAMLQRFADLEAAAHLIREAQENGMSYEPPMGRPHGGRRTKSRHPFPRRVGNVRAWALANRVSWAAAKGWYSEGKTRTKIPRKWAVILRHTHGIPFTAWKGGISDDIRAGRTGRGRPRKAKD